MSEDRSTRPVADGSARAESTGRKKRSGSGPLAAVALGASVVASGSAAADAGSPARDELPAEPAASTWSGTVSMEAAARFQTDSDGDLWPSCWMPDGDLISAWGDGTGFDPDGEFTDIGVARITGEPGSLEGANLAVGDEVGQVWTNANYTRKPTGMACVGDAIHLAVQDLAWDFNEAPAATILTSTDGGQTWTWEESGPMFDGGAFTTMWFADFGQANAWAVDEYVYVYGLDGNWRDSFSDRVPDPTEVFLARVPAGEVADREQWEFYTGSSGRHGPNWSSDMDRKAPVLRDERRVYSDTFAPEFISDMTTLSQGHVLYNQPLDRYLYASWTEYTIHLYEAPEPWGPWTRMSDHDFGGYPWTEDQHAGYGTTIPSKFLSEDGRSMWLQANVCFCAPSGISVYNYALRQVEIAPAQGGEPVNGLGEADLALASETVPIAKHSDTADLGPLNDGDAQTSVSDDDGERKTESWWGYTWPAPRDINRLSYTTGQVDDEGGYYLTPPRVEARVDGDWLDVPGQITAPVHEPGRQDGSFSEHTVSFPPVTADGIRVIGAPAGDRTYSSMSAIEVFHDLQVVDGSFESVPPLSGPPWTFEGGAGHGIDVGLGYSRTGEANAWVRAFDSLGTQQLVQEVSVEPGSEVIVSAWTQTSEDVRTVRLGARWDGGEVIEEFTAERDYTESTVTVAIPDDVGRIEILVGYDADGGDAVLQLDDVSITDPAR